MTVLLEYLLIKFPVATTLTLIMLMLAVVIFIVVTTGSNTFPDWGGPFWRRNYAL